MEPSDDPSRFADEVDSALENPSANRRGRVKNEGYESDSSDDGEGVVFSRKKVPDEDEDDDMFAAGAEDNGKDEEAGAKKKKKEFMRLGDIEGQEFGGHLDEPEDEDDAERRKKAGMGFELSSFNMREEMEEGKFTEDGSYVRSFDPHGVHDRWMEGLDEREIKMARRRKRQQEKQQKEKMQAEEQELEAAAARALWNKTCWAKPKVKAGDAMDTSGTSKAPSDIEHITHLASSIMSLGDTDIYSKTYEELVRDIRTSGHEEMKAWHKASYFGVTGEKVKVRAVGGEWGDWDDIVQ
ncbi:hypothetical protein BD779DRAFT_1610092 [Infundibulicybe gibba]|nr:hypothetical protein BD779DRAFT_1610092 [Infundibulicybe gibba]